MNNLQKDLIERIKNGELDMKPRWHFVLKTALLVVGTITAALLTIYLLSFVVFALHQSGVWFAPGFGLRGLGLCAVSSPWLLIVLTLIFLGILFLLVKHYAFSYKRPLVYTMIGVVLWSLLGAGIMQEIAVHERIRNFSEQYQLPGLAPLYRNAEQPLEGIYLGTVLERTDTGLLLQDQTGATLLIVIQSETRIRPNTDLDAGSQIAIIGDREGDTILAFGIKNILPGQPLPKFRGQQAGQVIAPLRQGRGTAATQPSEELPSEEARDVE